MGQLGWHVSHCHIREHVNLIAYACLEQKFLNQGVGKNWTAHFMQRHFNCIKMIDSHLLERLHAQAITKTQMAAIKWLPCIQLDQRQLLGLTKLDFSLVVKSVRALLLHAHRKDHGITKRLVPMKFHSYCYHLCRWNINTTSHYFWHFIPTWGYSSLLPWGIFLAIHPSIGLFIIASQGWYFWHFIPT